MPITTSAKKGLRGSARKQVFNLRRKRAMKDVLKKAQKLIAAGKTKEAQELLPQAYKAIDKAEKRGVIKKNTASRKKSRLSAQIKKSQ